MGKVTSSFFTVVLGAAAGAAYLAYRVSHETGKSYVEALSEVPAEAGRYWEELRTRGREAVDAGREAAQKKQSEIEEQLHGQSQPPSV